MSASITAALVVIFAAIGAFSGWALAAHRVAARDRALVVVMFVCCLGALIGFAIEATTGVRV